MVGVNGISYGKVLSIDSTMIADLYRQQLNRVAEKLKEDQDRIYYLRDNPRLHVAKSTHKKLMTIGWITISHSSYSPDLAITVHYLFRSHLREKKFDDENNAKIDLINFFDQKFKNFYEHGLLSLPERWQRVVDSDGAYITES